MSLTPDDMEVLRTAAFCVREPTGVLHIGRPATLYMMCGMSGHPSPSAVFPGFLVPRNAEVSLCPVCASRWAKDPTSRVRKVVR